jgi:hypothetical protein
MWFPSGAQLGRRAPNSSPGLLKRWSCWSETQKAVSPGFETSPGNSTPACINYGPVPPFVHLSPTRSILTFTASPNELLCRCSSPRLCGGGARVSFTTSTNLVLAIASLKRA